MPANAVILGPVIAETWHLEAVRAKVLSLLHHGNWHIWVGDGYGIEAEVLRLCLKVDERGNLSRAKGVGRESLLTVVGTSRRPANGAPMRYYQRVLTSETTFAGKRQDRDTYLLGMAAHVIRIGDEAPAPRPVRSRMLYRLVVAEQVAH